MSTVIIHPITPADRYWVTQVMIAEWGAETVVAHETVYRPVELPGIIAEQDGQPIGLLTYQIEGESLEIVTNNLLRQRLEVGSALIESERQATYQEKCYRLWLITTNDNTIALRFFQKRSFIVSDVHVNAIENARRLKPEITRAGMDRSPFGMRSKWR